MLPKTAGGLITISSWVVWPSFASRDFSSARLSLPNPEAEAYLPEPWDLFNSERLSGKLILYVELTLRNDWRYWKMQRN